MTFQPTSDLRPTLNRIREAVFSMIAHLSQSHGFIDGCAGSGIMATEASSMGFDPVWAFEPHRPTRLQIEANWSRLPVHGTLIGQSVTTIASQSLPAIPWVIYMDPPFRERQLHRSLLETLQGCDAIQTGSVYIAESEYGDPESLPAGWKTWKRRQYGRIHLWLGVLQ